jgi:hypothetical protein
MAHLQVRVDLMVEVKEQEPDVIDVLLPSSQKRKKEPDVSTANNWSSKQRLKKYLSDKEKKRKRSYEATKECQSNIKTGFYLLTLFAITNYHWHIC